MAEEVKTDNTTTEQQDLFVLDKFNANLAESIDKLFFEWFDDKYKLIRRQDEVDTDAALDRLTKLVRGIKSTVAANSTNKQASVFGNKLEEFLTGDSNAALAILHNRAKEDHISKVIWLINVITTVAVLSRELSDAEQPLDKGPLKRNNISVKNIEKTVVPIPNSTQMKSTSDFLGKVLPSTFAAVAKHKNLATAAGKRAMFTGQEYHNMPTFDTMYHDLGESLIFVSTAFFDEAQRALTENGKRLAADKVKHFDFKQLNQKEQDKMMQIMIQSFKKYANYTVELNLYSSINDKLILDSALTAYYAYLDDDMKNRCGFTEDQLRSLPNAIAFSKKFPNEYNSIYTRYSNKFIDGMTEALKKEQEAVQKTWFENKMTGEKEFRRGRLCGHGQKFMNTAPMKWLDEKLQKRSWLNPIMLIPKLAMTTLKVLTNPAVRKMRKKLTGTLFAGLRAFAQGVKEGFDSTGRSTEITYDDVIKKLKEAEEKLKNITNDKQIITAESTEISDIVQLLTEDEFSNLDDVDGISGDDDQPVATEKPKEVSFVDKLSKLANKLTDCNKLADKAISDTALAKDRQAYSKFYDDLKEVIDNSDIREKISNIVQANTDTDATKQDSEHTDQEVELAVKCNDLLQEFDEKHEEFDEVEAEREKLDASNAQDKQDATNSISVGEQTVQICEDVFATLNKYIARQWNLLAAHSRHEAMPLCAHYVAIDTDTLIKGAGKMSETTLADWLISAQRLDEMTDAQSDKIDSDQKIDTERRNTRDEIQNHNGKQTTEYPMKYGDKFRYHGLELLASTEDSSKNGFGIFANRLSKLAKPVAEFCSYVNALGDESSRKTFDNDNERDFQTQAAKDEVAKSNNEQFADDINIDDMLNEDIVNKIGKVVDKATDKVGNVGKSATKFAGKGVGKAIGNLVHGITHTSTADKDLKVDKTIEEEQGFIYKYNRTLKLSYLRDGANIVKSHCLTNSAKTGFSDIANLAIALSESNIANSRSIQAISDALNTFAEKVTSLKFAPCKSIVDYQLAEMINRGELSDTDDTNTGMIKGLFISGFDSTKEYSRDFNETDEEALQNHEDIANAERAANTTTANNTSSEEASEESSAENNAANTETAETNNTQQNAAAEQLAKQIDTAKPNEKDIQQFARRGEQQHNITVNDDNKQNATNNDTYTVKNTDNLMRTVSKADFKNMNRKQRERAVKQGIADENGNAYKSAKLEAKIGNIEKLSKLFEKINNIDWKDLLHG